MKRVGVIGAGAIGGQMAALLARTGVDVTITARGTNLDVIREAGLHLTGADGEGTFAVHATESLDQAEPVDAVILAVKANDTSDAIEQNSITREVPVMVIQNGLHAHTRLAELVGHERVAAGISTTAANSMDAGRVHVTASGRLFIGGDERILFARLLSPAVPQVSTVENIIGAQWTKLIINMVNAPPAIVGTSVQEAVANRHVRSVITRTMREAARTGLASGVRFESLQGLTPALIRLLAHAPLAVSEIIPKRMSGVMGSVPNLGSTQQSLRRGKPTEVDLLNGAVVEAATAIGRLAPANAAVTRLVHEREQGRPALTPAQLFAEVTE